VSSVELEHFTTIILRGIYFCLKGGKIVPISYDVVHKRLADRLRDTSLKIWRSLNVTQGLSKSYG